MVKRKIQIVNILIYVLLISFMAFGNLLADPTSCNCSGTVVKFNWEDGQFVLEEGHEAHGITISNVQVDASNEPYCFTWSSVNPWVLSVCLKLGTDYEDYPYPGGSGGPDQICASNSLEGTEGYHAISHIEFCVDEALPVELSLFSAALTGQSVSLIWETATEVNNYGFEIQRSFSDTDWQKVGFIEGHGNSNSPKYYSFSDNSLNVSGEYFYRLKQIDIDGQYEYSDVVNVVFNAPMDYQLDQNYPNPFNPRTTIKYSIPAKSKVTLNVFNVFGEKIASLVDATKEAGSYSVEFNAENLASGMYFYTIETENFKQTKKLILLK